MRLINSHKGIQVLAGFCTVVALLCLAGRLPVLLQGSGDTFTALAVGFTMPDGAKSVLRGGYSEETETQDSFPNDIASQPTDGTGSSSETTQSESVQPSSSNAASSQTVSAQTSGDGYPVVEKLITGAGTQYNNIYVKNSTSADINIGDELQKAPDVHISKNGEPQVLIMHTHTSESYLEQDNGVYPADHYPRSSDNNYNVTHVGDAIAQKLTAAGIGVIHDTTVHDNPTYNGSYYRSEDTIKKNLEQHPSIQVVLDIHRDALGTNETGRVKPVFTVNGKKAAQIMIVSGCDDDGTWDFPDWEINFRLALRIQQAAENRYPGMTRPVHFCPAQYNQHLTHGSLLIEVGSDANTIDEAVYAGSLLGDVLTEVLNNLTE